MADSKYDGETSEPEESDLTADLLVQTVSGVTQDAFAKEYAALWHFFQAMLIPLQADERIPALWWPTLIQRCRDDDDSGFGAVLGWISFVHPPGRRRFRTSWLLTSEATRAIFRRDAKAWLRSFAPAMSAPVNRPELRSVLPIRGHIATATLVADLVVETMCYLDRSEAARLSPLADRWVESAVLEDASAGNHFDLLCKAAADVLVTAPPTDQRVDRRRFPDGVGIPPEWFARYRHAVLKQQFLTDLEDLTAARKLVAARPMKIERCETRPLTKGELCKLVMLTRAQFATVDKFLRGMSTSAGAGTPSVAASAASTGAARVPVVATVGASTNPPSRSRLTASLKAKVALAALARPELTSTLALQHGVPLIEIQDWQMTVMRESRTLFASSQRSKVPFDSADRRTLKKLSHEIQALRTDIHALLQPR